MPDYMFLLESRLSPEQRAVMMRVQELSASMGFNLYLTGGTVRDLITGASLVDDHGRSAAAGFFAELDRHFAEPRFAWIVAGSDEWIVGHRAGRGARADDS